MMAACNNVTTYAAAQVFYWVGFDGMGYVLGVIVADTSSLRNRGLMYAFISSPYIATTWTGPSSAQSFLDGPGWRWGYGTFCHRYASHVYAVPHHLLLLHSEGPRGWSPQKLKSRGEASCGLFGTGPLNLTVSLRTSVRPLG